jgi:hypothetical protein
MDRVATGLVGGVELPIGRLFRRRDPTVVDIEILVVSQPADECKLQRLELWNGLRNAGSL